MERCINCRYAENTANVYSLYCKLHKNVVDRTDYCDSFLGHGEYTE